MTENSTVLAESSAAAVAEPKFDVKDQYTWSDEQREHWNKTGEMPEPPKKEDSAASKPAKAASEKVAGADGKAAESGTAKTKPQTEARFKELLEERKAAREEAEALKKELAELKAKAPPAEKKDEKTTASLAAEASKEPPPPERPKRPKMADFKTVAEYEDALDKHEEAMLEYPAKKHAYDTAKANFEKQKADLTAYQTKINDTWKVIADKGREIYGNDEWAKIASQQLPIYQNEPVERFIRDSGPETAAHLTQYFALKRSDLERIIALPAREQFRELEALETAMKEELSGKTSGSKPPEPKPRAPKPPSEVGGRGAASEDELLTAAKAKDFRGFEAEMNRRKFAKSN